MKVTIEHNNDKIEFEIDNRIGNRTPVLNKVISDLEAGRKVRETRLVTKVKHTREGKELEDGDRQLDEKSNKLIVR